VFKALKNIFGAGDKSARAAAEAGRLELQRAVAALLAECMRVDPAGADPREQAAAEGALSALFGCNAAESAALIAEGKKRAGQLTSYFAPVSVINRALELHERIALIEHLWRIAYAHDQLDPDEDQFVRKIAGLIYVSNTQSMVARSRARGSAAR
jgi:uncharacterized tellurite resistance protein B-like protein